MHVIIWSFQARPGHEADFERTYGPEGDWVNLFRRGAGYVRSELLRDLDTPGHYLVADYWKDPQAFPAFRRRWNAEYLALDRQCEALKAQEVSVGSFVQVDHGGDASGSRGQEPSRT